MISVYLVPMSADTAENTHVFLTCGLTQTELFYL